MSNETMTDALSSYIAAMQSQYGHTPAVRGGKLLDQRDEDRFAGWRLRGEAAQTFMGMPVVIDESTPADAIRVVAAAQGEQQAVACAHINTVKGNDGVRWCQHCEQQLDRRQPVAVARNAVPEPVEDAIALLQHFGLLDLVDAIREHYRAAPAAPAGMDPPVDQQRDMLAQAIRDAAVKAGIARAYAPMTGPILLMLCEDLANAAAPAPVAGDVMAPVIKWLRESANACGPSEYGQGCRDAMNETAEKLAALAQDRASQGAAAGVPEWFEDVRRCLDDVATQQRAHGYGDGRMVQLLARMSAWLAAAPSAPTQGAAAGVPEGWRLVPAEPDAKMLDAAFVSFPDFSSDTQIDQIWAAMVAAAPQPDAEREVGRG